MNDKLTYAERKFGNGWFALGILIILVVDTLVIWGGSVFLNWAFNL